MRKICTKFGSSLGKKTKRTPLFVPVALIAIGLVLLPFDCIYNQALALLIITIGGYSITTRVAEHICSKRGGGEAIEPTEA